MHADSLNAFPLEAAPSITFVAETGDAPGALVRIIEAFARRGIVIDGLTYNRIGDHARLEAQVHGMAANDARQVAGQIRQVIGVTHLEIKRVADPAERMRLCA